MALLLMAAFAWSPFSPFPFVHGLRFALAAALLWGLALVLGEPIGGFRYWARELLPTPFIPYVFLNLGPLIPVVNPRIADELLMRGADIGTGGDGDKPVRDPDLGIERYNRVIRTIRGMEKPVIAAVNGAAAGAGFGIALASDFRIASEKAKFVTAFARIALSSDSGVAYWLPKIVGHQRATELLFSSRVVLADEALQIGLVNEVVAPEDLGSRVTELAETYARAATKAIGLTKRILNNSWELPLAAHLDFEAHAQSLTGSSFDFEEGVKAFQEKRDPAFQGR